MNYISYQLYICKHLTMACRTKNKPYRELSQDVWLLHTAHDTSVLGWVLKAPMKAYTELQSQCLCLLSHHVVLGNSRSGLFTVPVTN